MKRSYLIATPPIIFVVTAIFAYICTSPKTYTSAEDNSQPNTVLRQASVAIKPIDMEAALRRMESRILPHNPALPIKTYSAKEMDDVVVAQKNAAVFPGYNFPAYEYARDWARNAPEEMFAWLLGKNGEAEFEANILFGQWAQVDLDAALAAALQISNQKLRAQALMTTLENLCHAHPVRAKKILLENAELFSKETGSSISFAYDLTQTTWDLISTLPSGKERAHLQANLLGRSGSENYAQELWKQASEAQRSEWLAAGFTPSWGAGSTFEGLHDNMRAKAETTGNPADATKFIENHGSAWAEHDLAAAFAWTQTHVKGKSKSKWIGDFFHSGIQKDFENTLRVWQQLPEGYQKKDIAEAILRATPEDRKAEAKAVLKLE